MPKSITSNLENHLSDTVTSLAMCWHVTRTDGVEFFFTTHDSDLIIDGDTYAAANSFQQTAISNDSTMSVDNLDVMGILDSSEITESDLRAGRFDFADVEIFMVNHQSPSDGKIKLRKGTLGEVTISTSGTFNVELRGMSQQLSQSIVEVYTPDCRADLGDKRCTIPLDPNVRQNETEYSVGEYIKVPTAEGADYDRYENRIYRCTVAGTSLSTQPTYDTTVGNSTQELEKATGVLTLSSTGPLDTETFTVGGKTYTLQETLTDVDGNILLGASNEETVGNIVAAISLGAGAGTVYANSMIASSDVDVLDSDATSVTVQALTGGVGGNSITTTDTLTNGSWGAATLTGGLTGPTFIAEEAWTRGAVVTGVESRRVFNIEVTEPRAVDGWFKGGVLKFDTGFNAGVSMEIKDWQQAGGDLTLFLAVPFNVQEGDKCYLYPGCDKRLTSCVNKFSNINNFRGEPYVPGQDEFFTYPDSS